MDNWREEFKAGSQSELVEVRKIMEKECKGWCIEVKCKKRRWILTKLRDGEGVEHLVMRCTSVAGEREKLMRLIRKMVAE